MAKKTHRRPDTGSLFSSPAAPERVADVTEKDLAAALLPALPPDPPEPAFDHDLPSAGDLEVVEHEQPTEPEDEPGLEPEEAPRPAPAAVQGPEAAAPPAGLPLMPLGSPFEDDPIPEVVPPVSSVPPPGASKKMHATALVFLDDPVARRLAVAWATCHGDEAAWFETAGLPRHDQNATRLAKALRVNLVCRDDGTTDVLALQYVQAMISRPLQAAARGKKTKGD